MNDIDDYRLPEPSECPDEPVPSDALDGGLPASIESERTVLGSILLETSAFNEAAEVLNADDFAWDSHQRLFSVIAEMVDGGHAVDIVTLTEELRRQKITEAVGGASYLASLIEGLPRHLSIAEYIRIVKSKSQLRRMINLCSTSITRAADQSEAPLEIIDDIEAQLLEIAYESNTAKLCTVQDSVAEAGGLAPYLKAMTSPDLRPGLPTGFIDYDEQTGGLQKQELTIIAARPSMGKSALAINMATNVGIDTGKVVATFSLEMNRHSLEQRMVASTAGVDLRRAQQGGYLSTEQHLDLAKAMSKLVESKIHIDDSGILTVSQIRAKCRRLKQRERRLDLVIIDYLQLITGATHGVRHSNRQEEVAAISRSLKALAKELDCPVLALAQLNRSSEQRKDKRPILSDLRESGQVEQDADVVAFIHRESYYDPDDIELQGLAELIIAKQRNGPTGIVNVAYIDKLTKFTNLARR